MRVDTRRAFTIVEALVAIVVLSVGILALVGSAALASRMAGRGGQGTRSALTAAARMARLRQVAASTVPACSGAEWRSDSAGGLGVTESWQILDPAGPARRVRIVLRARHPGGTSSDTVVTSLLCLSS